jgi:hypothetical protein
MSRDDGCDLYHAEVRIEAAPKAIDSIWEKCGADLERSAPRCLNQAISAPEGIRTPNLLIRSQMLYPLSYGRNVQL